MRGRDLTILIGVILVAIIVFGTLGLLMYSGYGYGGMMRGPAPGGYGLIVGGIVWLVIASAGRGPGVPPQPTDRARCFDILRDRYAKGEITREQYQQMFTDLEAGGACPYTRGASTP